MNTPLRVLQIEDSPVDIELVHEQLIEEGIQSTIQRVETPEEVVAAFGRGGFDIIFCDYSLPKYDGVAVLELACEMCPDIPFIFVSGTIGETRAIEALKLGATDYVLKNDLRRLGTCVQRALRESRERVRRQRAEKRISTFSALAHKLSLTATAEEAGRVIVEVADDLFGWDACTLHLYMADQDIVIPIINIDIVEGNRREVPATHGNKPPTPRMRRIMEHGAQIILRQPPFEFADSIPFGDVQRPSASLMFVPIRNGRSMIGILSIQSYTINAYSDEDLVTLQSLADHCGGALERIRGELALRESEERYRHFFEEDLAGAYFSTADGKILACNPEFARILGFNSVEEALRTNPEYLFVDPGGRVLFLNELRKKKKLRHHEEIIRRKDGKEIHVLENVVGIFDEAGELTQLTGYLFDVSEQKSLAEQLRQSQKMEGIGTLAGGIAHDFNNILGIILGNVALLEARQVETENIPQSFHAVTQAVQRGAALVQQLLTFASRSGVAVEVTNVNAVIEELVAMLQPTFPKTIEVLVHLDPTLPHVLIDQNQLHQALFNLCLNARDAMSSRGVLSIKSMRIKKNSLEKQLLEATEDEYVRISVTDTGKGMDEATRHRIFEPFFTTKEKGKGTGLGLAVVYGAVKSVNGFVDVESEPGRGTTFHIYAPVPSASTGSAIGQKPATDEITGGTETILLVEDEELLAMVTKAALETKGYSVIHARDGLEAIELYKENKDRIGLVLSDFGLPKMSGVEAIERMKRINPDLKCILVSGYLDPDQRADIERSKVNDIIEKPYLPRDILRRIREILDT